MSKNIAVIVTYKRQIMFDKLMKSIALQEDKFDYIYVVDNESSIVTERLVRSFGTNYIYLNPLKNLGCAGGFNYGTSILLNEHRDGNLVFLDDDVVLKKNFISVINENKLLQSGNCIIPSKKYIDGTIFLWSPILTKNKLFVKRNIESSSTGILNHPIKVDNITFEGCIIDLKIIREIGLPRKEFFIDGDDFEYGIRINKVTSIFKIPDILIERQIKIETVEKSLDFFLFKFKSIRSRQTEFRLYYEIRNKYLIAKCLGYNKIQSIFFIFPHYIKLLLGVCLFREMTIKKAIIVLFKASAHGVFNRFGELKG
jgi:GT2 family glycosyltransferase